MALTILKPFSINFLFDLGFIHFLDGFHLHPHNEMTPPLHTHTHMQTHTHMKSLSEANGEEVKRRKDPPEEKVT